MDMRWVPATLNRIKQHLTGDSWIETVEVIDNDLHVRHLYCVCGRTFPYCLLRVCVRSDSEELRPEAMWEGQSSVCHRPSRLWPSSSFLHTEWVHAQVEAAGISSLLFQKRSKWDNKTHRRRRTAFTNVHTALNLDFYLSCLTKEFQIIHLHCSHLMVPHTCWALTNLGRVGEFGKGGQIMTTHRWELNCVLCI